MSGAACLAGSAALRSGAGLVTVAVPSSVQSVVAGFEPSYTTAGLPCSSDGQLSRPDPAMVTELLHGKQAVGIGPGLGQSDNVVSLLKCVLEQTSVPLILDADALNIVAAQFSLLSRRSPTILTPHPGEFSRLSGLSVAKITGQRHQAAENYARQSGCIVVLKGSGTVITDGTQTGINATGNAGMATGGSGDVLTGIIVSLCAQGMQPLAAAQVGVHAHGLAGDLCATASSERGLIASDLLTWLPHAWRQMQKMSDLSTDT